MKGGALFTWGFKSATHITPILFCFVYAIEEEEENSNWLKQRSNYWFDDYVQSLSHLIPLYPTHPSLSVKLFENRTTQRGQGEEGKGEREEMWCGTYSLCSTYIQRTLLSHSRALLSTGFCIAISKYNSLDIGIGTWRHSRIDSVKEFPFPTDIDF